MLSSVKFCESATYADFHSISSQTGIRIMGGKLLAFHLLYPVPFECRFVPFLSTWDWLGKLDGEPLRSGEYQAAAERPRRAMTAFLYAAASSSSRFFSSEPVEIAEDLHDAILNTA